MTAATLFVWLIALSKLYASTCILGFTVLFCLLTVNGVSAQQSSGLGLSMPVEYVNYTIVSRDDCLWAKIDGTYPIYVTGELPELLPMVYPTPPQTTNIQITLDGKELSYSNYTDAYPSALHHTAIGDWAMVATVISPVTEKFTLGIHYEHPLQVVNGSALFLYDLNISPYLSPQNPNSTAYFTVRLQANITDVKAFTTETDIKWNPMDYTVSSDGNVDVVSIVMFSEYGKPLLGDLVVEFSNVDAVPEFHMLALAFVMAAAFGVLVFTKNRFKRQFA
jgi:hypothetical protein